MGGVLEAIGFSRERIFFFFPSLCLFFFFISIQQRFSHSSHQLSLLDVPYTHSVTSVFFKSTKQKKRKKLGHYLQPQKTVHMLSCEQFYLELLPNVFLKHTCVPSADIRSLLQ